MSRLPATSASHALRTSPLPADVARIVERELADDERVVWLGQPVVRWFSAATIAQMLFAVPWTAFALFWMWGASQASVAFALFGLPFVGVGVAMLTSPVWAARAAKRTAYVVTNKRAIVVSTPAGLVPSSALNVRSFLPEALGALERSERGDGSGDLVFARETVRGAKGSTRVVNVGFVDVPDAFGVERHVRELVESARSV